MAPAHSSRLVSGSRGARDPTGVTGDALRGKAIYESRCTACHSLDHSRIGPSHRGVFGRHAAWVPDFDYSPALRRRP